MLPERMHNSFFEELGELKLLDTACKNIGLSAFCSLWLKSCAVRLDC